MGFGVGCRVSARHRLSRPHCRGAGPGTSFPGPFRQLLPAHLCLGSVGFGVGCRVSAQHRLSRPHCRGVSSGTSFSDPFRQLLPAHLSRFGGFRGALSCLCAASAFPAALPRCGFRCILFRPLPAALAGAPLPRSPQGRADAESKFANCPHGRPAGRLSGHFERSRPAGRCASGAVSDCRIAEVSAASPNRDRSCDTVLAMPSRTADCIRRAHALFAAGRRSLRAIRTKRPGGRETGTCAHFLVFPGVRSLQTDRRCVSENGRRPSAELHRRKILPVAMRRLPCRRRTRLVPNSVRRTGRRAGGFDGLPPLRRELSAERMTVPSVRSAPSM